MCPARRFLILSIAAVLIAGCASNISKTPEPLTGTPSWFPIGPEIYQEGDITAAEYTVLKLRTEPRWFEGFSVMAGRKEFDAYMHKEHPQEAYSVQQTGDDRYPIPSLPPYPKSAADLPLDDHGVKLSLSMSPSSDPAVLMFDIDLSSEHVEVTREVEHRFSNALPMLFAFYVDQKAVEVKPGGSVEQGGATWITTLVNVGETRRWNLKVDAQSLGKILPDNAPHRLTAFAVFANFQHHYYARATRMSEMISINGIAPTRILVRSNAASLRWDGQRWLAD